MPADVLQFRYRLAGLDIVSDLELLEGRPAVNGDPLGAPLVIESGPRLGLPAPDGGNARSRDGRRVRLVVPGIGRFHIDDGCRVVAWPEAGTSAETLSQQLSGTVLALVLMQRDVLVLHGSVIAFGDRALVVMGHSGDGKSTTAAACARAGHTLLSDDLAPLDLADRVVTVRPTCALVRLGHEPGLARPEGRHWLAAGKTAVRLGSDPSDAPTRVVAIVRLVVDEDTGVQTMTGSAAVLALLEHVFCRPAFPTTRAAWAMQQCARIASTCPVVTLARPKRIDVLDDVVARLERLAVAGT